MLVDGRRSCGEGRGLTPLGSWALETAHMLAAKTKDRLRRMLDTTVTKLLRRYSCRYIATNSYTATDHNDKKEPGSRLSAELELDRSALQVLFRGHFAWPSQDRLCCRTMYGFISDRRCSTITMIRLNICFGKELLGQLAST